MTKKIKNILIANRGEIACRIIQTASKLGIKTHVLRTAKEPKALYLQLADNIIDAIEEKEGISVFLDVDQIIEIAKKNKIQAIHPGYGFLSENPYFAQRCEDEKIIFIGPSANVIYKMGNKTIAKQIARTNKIPLLEGSKDSLKSVDEALKIAHKIGYPVILKAASGGGGRGMRIVERDEDMQKHFINASNESEKAFNDASLFIEKYVKSPKHIEFQILGDSFGNVVYLGERECSIQRKHQKLIEEAPSAALDEDLRAKMGAVAVKIAKSVNYYSAGTVEFLLDENKNFYFMEMNTRIQVEHPVTELITGLDLIEQQIRIAEGKKLALKQEDIKLKGWAIECRINAEDVQNNFAPYLGTIKQISIPKGKNIRVDAGILAGMEITPYFDSMIAKLIVYGHDREECISNTLDALRRIKISGVKTTIPFCKAVLTNSVFRSGNYSTAFLTNDIKELHLQELYEELLASFIATHDFYLELQKDNDVNMDNSKSKEISPWVLNKRIKAL